LGFYISFSERKKAKDFLWWRSLFMAIICLFLALYVYYKAVINK